MKAEEKLRQKGDVEIHSVSAVILRTGVVLSVGIMLLGLVLGLAGGVASVDAMKSARFSSDFGALAGGVLRGDGLSLIELGIVLLVLTPILRVASSMAIFFLVEEDWFYGTVTLLVLGLTLLSLLVLR